MKGKFLFISIFLATIIFIGCEDNMIPEPPCEGLCQTLAEYEGTYIIPITKVRTYRVYDEDQDWLMGPFYDTTAFLRNDTITLLKKNSADTILYISGITPFREDTIALWFRIPGDFHFSFVPDSCESFGIDCGTYKTGSIFFTESEVSTYAVHRLSVSGPPQFFGTGLRRP